MGSIPGNVPIWIYRIIAFIVLAISCNVELGVIWASVDTVLAAIIFINVFALLALYKYAKYAYDNYQMQLNAGVEDPVWDPNTDITKVDLNNSKEILQIEEV